MKNNTETPKDNETILVDGIMDKTGNIQYWGIATKQPNGFYRCYANVNGSFCIVEISIDSFLDIEKKTE